MKCVMCGKETKGFYLPHEKAEPIYVCFEHYEDGTFADYLKENGVEDKPYESSSKPLVDLPTFTSGTT